MEKQTEQTKEIAWTTKEFKKHDRGPRWFFWMTLLLGFLILVGLYTRNPLFVLILVLLALLWGYFEQQGPDAVRIEIAMDGITIGDEYLPFTDCKDFHIIYNPPEVKKLHIRLVQIGRATRKLPLEGQDPMAIRHFLAPYIPENLDIDEESLMDRLVRILKL